MKNSCITLMPHLCLGTAQFGLDYGITNKTGKISINNVRKILDKAFSEGIHRLDTANNYGEAEKIIGREIKRSTEYKITTKLTRQSQEGSVALNKNQWNKELKAMQKKLGHGQIETLLIHDAEDIRQADSNDLITWLQQIKSEEQVKRIGVSIYDSEDLEGIDLNWLDVVQLPLSLLDQRAKNNGIIRMLRKHNIAIQARSIYLQGLLLTPANQWPNWMPSEVKKKQEDLEIFSKNRGYTLLDLAVGFIVDQEDIETAVIGISSVRELEQLIQAWNNPPIDMKDEWSEWAIEDAYILDPRRWPSKFQ